MKNILILGRRDDRPDYDTAGSMARSLNEVTADTIYTPCFLEELVFYFDGVTLKVFDTRNGREISEYDGIFLIGWFKFRRLEDTALSIAMYANAHNIPCMNSEALNNRSRSKLSQLVAAVISNVPTGPFVASIDKSRIIEKVQESGMRFPLIVKSASASRGDNNYLVKDAQDLKLTLNQAPMKIFIAQPFIRNDGDYRLLVMSGEVKLAIHRKAVSDSHLNNTSQGGTAEIVDLELLDKSMLDDAITMSRILGREITGVDMITDLDSGQHFMLEVNNMPQLSTGSFTSHKAQVLDAALKYMVAQNSRE